MAATLIEAALKEKSLTEINRREGIKIQKATAGAQLRLREDFEYLTLETVLSSNLENVTTILMEIYDEIINVIVHLAPWRLRSRTLMLTP